MNSRFSFWQDIEHLIHKDLSAYFAFGILISLPIAHFATSFITANI